MNKDINKAINRLIEMSAQGGLSGDYENSVVGINFKVTEQFEFSSDNDTYRFWYITEINASPAEVKIKKSDIKDVKYFAEGEFKPCPFCEVIQIFFNDGSQLDFFEDYR